MSRTLFGTDGIRGLANAGVMTPEIAFRLGAAVTLQAKRKVSHPPRIVIGKDTRLSGYLFESSIASGICALGGKVLLSGPLPTPAIAHLTTSMRADAGIVISASHNPYDDNGIKVFGADGFKLPDEIEKELEYLIVNDVIDKKRPTGKNLGVAERLDDAPGRYVAFVKSTFPSNLTLEGLTIVVDAAHGAAYKTAPLVFSELGATTYAIGIKPDGLNINAKVGALHPEHCAREVKKRKAHIGICLDGDADRLIIIDENGNEVDGDAIMALCATRMIREKRLSKKTLVATIMSNLGLERSIQNAGGKLVRSSVGDRYVVETMRKHGYNFGGEQSGHLVFLDHVTTGDGLVGALQVLAIMIREEKPLSELAHHVIERVPQILVNVKCASRRPLEELSKTCRTIQKIESILGKEGRVLVRWSGTESKLRIMIEGPNSKKIETYAQEISMTAQKELSV